MEAVHFVLGTNHQFLLWEQRSLKLFVFEIVFLEWWLDTHNISGKLLKRKTINNLALLLLLQSKAYH